MEITVAAYQYQFCLSFQENIDNFPLKFYQTVHRMSYCLIIRLKYWLVCYINPFSLRTVQAGHSPQTLWGDIVCQPVLKPLIMLQIESVIVTNDKKGLIQTELNFQQDHQPKFKTLIIYQFIKCNCATV